MVMTSTIVLPDLDERWVRTGSVGAVNDVLVSGSDGLGEHGKGDDEDGEPQE